MYGQISLRALGEWQALLRNGVGNNDDSPEIPSDVHETNTTLEAEFALQ